MSAYGSRISQKSWESLMNIDQLTRPIIGIEYRTPHEVFDIMADRIRSALVPPAVPGIAELAGEYLAAIDADPVKDIWDTWDGKPKQGAEMTSSDQAWEEHGQNAARCLKRLRDALSEGRS